jgi:hypothetical protein
VATIRFQREFLYQHNADLKDECKNLYIKFNAVVEEKKLSIIEDKTKKIKLYQQIIVS